MEENKFIPPFGQNSMLRSTNEEVEIIDCFIGSRGERSSEDWVTYIDSKGNEHIKELLNIQLDFKSTVSDTFKSLLDSSMFKNVPTVRNARIYEVSKEIFLKDFNMDPEIAVKLATEFINAVGIEEMQ